MPKKLTLIPKESFDSLRRKKYYHRYKGKIIVKKKLAMLIELARRSIIVEKNKKIYYPWIKNLKIGIQHRHGLVVNTHTLGKWISIYQMYYDHSDPNKSFEMLMADQSHKKGRKLLNEITKNYLHDLVHDTKSKEYRYVDFYNMAKIKQETVTYRAVSKFVKKQKKLKLYKDKGRIIRS